MSSSPDPFLRHTDIIDCHHPAVVRQAFAVHSSDEAEFAEVLPDPLECVVDALRASRTWRDALASLPDLSLKDAAAVGLTPRAVNPRA